MDNTAEGKAKELLDKFYDLDEFTVQCGMYCIGGTIDRKAAAKQCALICVDEILNEFPMGYNGNFEQVRKRYWERVRTAIEKL